MEHSPLSRNLRQLRGSRHWTQEELAAAAGVDVRTVQRAEAGARVGIESLKALAAAFDTTVETLTTSEQELEAELERFRKNYAIVDLCQTNRGVDITQFLEGAEAFEFHRVREFNDEQLDALASFEEDLRDWLDICSDMTPTRRRDAERSLDGHLATLAALQVFVSVGEEAMKLKGPDSPPFELHVLHVAAVSATSPLTHLVRERNHSVRFKA